MNWAGVLAVTRLRLDSFSVRLNIILRIDSLLSNLYIQYLFEELEQKMESMNYWIGELGNKSDATKQKYKEYFIKFSEFTRKSPEELLEQRKQDVKSEDVMTRRRIERSLENLDL